jgi:two-component system sensor histidine kinase KdpD
MHIEKLLSTVRSTIIYIRNFEGEIIYSNQPIPQEWLEVNKYEKSIIDGLEREVSDKARGAKVRDSQRSFSSSYSYSKDDNQDLIVVSSQDITSRVYVEEKIKHAIRDIEHTFRNASTTAKLAIANFIDGNVDAECLEALLQMADQRFEDAERLIVAINRGRLTKIREVMVNHDVFKPLLVKLSPICGQKNITLVNNLPETLMVLSNEVELSIVAADIINNAIKHGGDNIIITISGEKNLNKVKICIENTGVPIPESKLQYLFSIDCPSETGMGFGLFSARRKITDHGGDLFYCKTDEGHPCFDIILPTI